MLSGVAGDSLDFRAGRPVLKAARMTPPDPPPLELKMRSAEMLQFVVDAAKGICEDMNLECTETGITAQTMNREHMALLALSLEDSSFAEYRCSRPLTLGVSVARLQQVLRTVERSDVVRIRASPDGDCLSFGFEGLEASKLGEVSLKLLDLDSEFLAIPEQEYKAELWVPAMDFKRVFSDSLRQFGNVLQISADAKGFSVSSGDELCAVRHSWGVNGVAYCRVIEPCVGKFRLQQIASLADATKGGFVVLRLSTGAPLLAEYRPWGHNARLRLYLAPYNGV